MIYWCFACVTGGCWLTASRSAQYKSTNCVSAFLEAASNYFAHYIKTEKIIVRERNVKLKYHLLVDKNEGLLC